MLYKNIHTLECILKFIQVLSLAFVHKIDFI